MTFFADTSLLMRMKKVAPIADWYKSTSQLEAWALVYAVFLRNESKDPTTFDMFQLIEETESVRPCLCAQARQKIDFFASFLFMIQKDFSKSFNKELERRKRDS